MLLGGRFAEGGPPVIKLSSGLVILEVYAPPPSSRRSPLCPLALPAATQAHLPGRSPSARPRLRRPGRGRPSSRWRDHLQRPRLVPRRPRCCAPSTDQPRPRLARRDELRLAVRLLRRRRPIIYVGSSGDGASTSRSPPARRATGGRGAGRTPAARGSPRRRAAAFSTLRAAADRLRLFCRQTGASKPGSTQRISGRGHIRSVAVAVNALATSSSRGIAAARSSRASSTRARGGCPDRARRGTARCASPSRSATTAARSSAGSTSA